MTNSVVQGKQAGDLWTPLFQSGLKIKFAHNSFKWHNLASKNAGVTVVIVAVTKEVINECKLYQDDLVKTAKSIGCFLIPNQVKSVISSNVPISDLPEMVFGNMPRDGGHLILSKDEAIEVKKTLNAENKGHGLESTT